MTNYIDGIDFFNLEAMKYWSAPASWSIERKKKESKDRIFSGEWYGSQKRDGAWYKFLKDEDGNYSLTGRSRSVSGEYLDKFEWLPQLKEWADSLPNGTCFLGEVYLPANEIVKSTTSIMNCLKEKAIQRQNAPDKTLVYYVFDVLAFNGKSFVDVAAKDRFALLESFGKTIQVNRCPYVEYATYVTGQALWETLQTLLSKGYEGMVITRGAAPYQPGKRPSKDTLKIKKELSETIDCFFTGRATKPAKEYTGKEIENWEYYVDAVTDQRLPITNHYYDYNNGEAIIPVTKSYYYGFAGSLEIGLVKDGKIVPIGLLSGLTEEIKKNYQDYKLRVIEVGAMQIDPVSLNLRHGKMLGFRDDKNWQECEWGQLLQ